MDSSKIFDNVYDNVELVFKDYIDQFEIDDINELRVCTSEVGRALISYGATLVGGSHGRTDTEILEILEKTINDLRNGEV